MQKLLKAALAGGAAQGSYSVYTNYVKKPPPNPGLNEQKNKKIVVVGGGIIGLSTAYYLSQYGDN